MKFNIITSILVVLSVVLYGEVVLKNNNDKDKKNYEKLSLNEYKKTSTLPIINIKSDSKINFVEVFNLQGKIIYEKYNSLKFWKLSFPISVDMVCFLADNDINTLTILSDSSGFFRLLFRFGDCPLLSQSSDCEEVEA